jgi:putative acetyltransferase
LNPFISSEKKEVKEKRPKTITLKDRTTVSLRLLTIGDLGKLCRMLWSLTDKTRVFFHDFVVLNFSTFLSNYFKFLLRLLLNSLEYRRHGSYFLGVIALNNHKKVIGFVYLGIKSYGFFAYANYGIVVHDDYQGKGLGDVLTSHILEYGKKLELNKITLTVLTANEKAIQLYKKYGFVIEGLHKRTDVWKDKVFDVYYMALHLK